MRQRWEPEDKKVLALLYEEGWSLEALAIRFERTVYSIKTELGRTLPPNSKRRKTELFFRDPLDLAARTLYDIGFSVKTISIKLNITPDEVILMLKNSSRGSISTPG